MMAYRGIRSEGLLILNLNTSWQWMVSFTPCPPYPWERTSK